MRRPRLNNLCFVLAGLVLPVSTEAALNIKQAVELASSRNASILEAREKANQLRYLSYGAWSNLLPLVNLEGSRTHRKDAVANRSVGSVPFGGEPYNLYNVSLKGSQPLFQWGILSKVRKAGYERDLQVTELEITERDVIRNVIAAFYKVVVDKNSVEILLDQEKAVQDALSMAQNRMRLGGGRKLDVLQMRTQLALLKPKIENARIELTTSAAALAHLLGEQEKTSLELMNTLPSLKGKLTEAKEVYLPELERLRLNREKVDADKSISLGNHLPQLKLVGDYSFINYTKADLMDDASNSWAVQLLVTVPIFSGLSSIQERRALNSLEAQLDYEEVNLRNDIDLTQIKSRKAMEAAEANLVSAEEAADLARQSMVQGRNDFRLGIIDFLQYLQVQESQLEAALSLNKLKFDLIVAYSNYYAASGRSIPELVSRLAAEGP